MTTPFFPPPRPRPTGYRAPADATPPLPEAPAKIVVQRAELPPDSNAPARPPPAAFAGIGQRERTYWQRHRFFARHPRIVGGFLTVVGSGLTASLIDTLLHGGAYGIRGPLLAGPALFVGLWSLAVGYPLDDEGNVPSWYKLGLFLSTVGGFGFGLALLLVLLGQSA